MSQPPPSKTQLTERQHEVLRYVQQHISDHGFPPTTRELSDACRLGSPSAAHRMLSVLERKGYLVRTPHSKRALTIAPPDLRPADLDTTLVEIIATSMGAQDVAVECTIRAALENTDPQRRSALLRDALEHHELTTMILDALAGFGLVRGEGSGVDELRRFREGVPWMAFVVDHVVYNRAVLAGCQQLERQLPSLSPLWERLKSASGGAADKAEGWLNEGWTELPDTERARLRARGSALLGMMAGIARGFGHDPFTATQLPAELGPG